MKYGHEDLALILSMDHSGHGSIALGPMRLVGMKNSLFNSYPPLQVNHCPQRAAFCIRFRRINVLPR